MQRLNRLFPLAVIPLVILCTAATWVASPGKGSHAAGGGGSAAFRSISGTNYTNRTDCIITAPTGIANGDILLLFFILAGSTAAPTPTLPSGFTLIQGPTTVTDGSFSVVGRVAYKVASGESGDYTVSHTTFTSQGIIVCVSGASGSTPVSSVNTGTGTTSTATGVTTPSNNSVVCFVAQNWQTYNGTSSPPTGTTPTFTEQWDPASDTHLMYVATGVLATAGATGNKTQANRNGPGEPWAAWLVAVGP